MTDFQREAIRLALLKMFRDDGHFSICTVDALLKLAGAVPDRRAYDELSVLHCVGMRDMPPVMRQELLNRTLALLDAEPLDLSKLGESYLSEPAVATPRPSLFGKVRTALTS